MTFVFLCTDHIFNFFAHHVIFVVVEEQTFLITQGGKFWKSYSSFHSPGSVAVAVCLFSDFSDVIL